MARITMLPCRLLLVAALAFPLLARADAAADRRTEQQVTAALNQQPTLRGEVRSKSTDGIVVLTGRVRDRDERALAGEIVRAIPGVLGVDNQLELGTPQPERADGWIALKVRSALLLGRNVSAATTDVAVQDGIVTLTGTVENERQSRLTAAYARDVEGVRSVRNQLIVRPGEQAGAAPPVPSTDETTLAAAVSTVLRSDRSLARARISVEAEGPVVLLRGRVASQADRDLATKLAAAVPSVRSVTNDLVVEAAE